MSEAQVTVTGDLVDAPPAPIHLPRAEHEVKVRTNLCKKHPYYKAVRRPTANCEACRAAWREKHPQAELALVNPGFIAWLKGMLRILRSAIGRKRFGRL